jgi:hypothetical protein
VAATARCAQLDRRRIRARFEQRFSAERMAQDYRRVYEQVMRRSATAATAATATTAAAPSTPAGAGATALAAAPQR